MADRFRLTIAQLNLQALGVAPEKAKRIAGLALPGE